jgi:hypothetical protein
MQRSLEDNWITVNENCFAYFFVLHNSLVVSLFNIEAAKQINQGGAYR